MRKNTTVYLKTLLACGVLLVAFLAVYLLAVGFSSKGFLANQNSQNVPYYQTDAPETYGALFTFGEGMGVYFYFDTDAQQTLVLLLQNGADARSVEAAGYEVDTLFAADYDFLAAFIDNLGGILLKTREGELNFTGVQVTEQLSLSNSVELRRTVIKKVLSKAYLQGVTAADMLFLIENCETAAGYPSLYLLPETVNASLSQISFIN